LVLVASTAAFAMGMGPFFSLLAGLNLLSAAFAGTWYAAVRQAATRSRSNSSLGAVLWL
jgi:hypothetical protein